MSGDSIEANAAFAQKYQLPFPLLSDETGEVCRSYASCDDIASGRVRRNTYVIGSDGVILKQYQDVDPKDQAEVVLAFLEESSSPTEQESAPAGRISLGANSYADLVETHTEKDVIMEDPENEISNNQAYEGNGAQEAAVGHKPGPAVKTVKQPTSDPVASVSPSSMPADEAQQPEMTKTDASRQVQAAQNAGGPALVFALGTLGYDFGSEARRDSLMQHMGDEDLLAYLDNNPSQAASIIWTLNLDTTPIYAIQPQGPFADDIYGQLRRFLREQSEDGVERVSIPGVVLGQTRLLSGQGIPAIQPELRCMYSWTTAALIEAVCGKPPAKSAKAEDQEAYDEQTEAVANFLHRIYDELRNLGVTSQERAMNYSGANVASTANVFESALKSNLELYGIEAAPSPICRPGSDCWEVRLSFFDPENVLRAKRVYGFTVDVSDVCPVMVGKIRSWSMP